VTSLLPIVDASITAAIDESMHVECVYVLMRRNPDVLQQELLSPLAAVQIKSQKTRERKCLFYWRDGTGALLCITIG
jgi:hypothetical protein